MADGPIDDAVIERAICEQIAYLQAYLDELRTRRQLVRHSSTDDPFQAAYRDPGFQRWQLQKRLERPL